MFCNACGRGISEDAIFCTYCGIRVGMTAARAASVPNPGMDYRLERPRSGRWVAGVCAAVARALELNVTVVRLLWLGLTILSAGFPGVIAYGIAWVVIPQQPLLLTTGYYANAAQAGAAPPAAG